MDSDKILRRFSINDFLPAEKRDEAYEGAIYCSEAARRAVRIQLLGSIGMYRNHRIRITSPDLYGQSVIWLGHGESDIMIDTSGPIHMDLRVWRDSTVKIGKGTTINQARIIADDADISIGEDNLWSDEIILQSSDQHGIYDLKTAELIRNDRKTFVTEGHVWIGRRATLMPDVRIGAGSIVGAGSVVTKSIEHFCAAAGNPARVIKRNTTWSRSVRGFSAAEKAGILQDYRNASNTTTS